MDDSGFSFASYFASTSDEPADPMPTAVDSRPSRLHQEIEFPPKLVRFAKQIKAIRDSRIALLDASLFGEPAWNILLALYVAAGERYALSISALCAESGVPATTAARSINRLLELGMVRRVPNPGDNRSTYIELSRDAGERLTKLLGSARNKYLAD